MSEEVVLRAVHAFGANWLPRPRPGSVDEDGAVVIGLDVTATGAGSGAPVDELYWLGARVRGGKITFFGFFRTEEDALEAVNDAPT
jgi:hypothetical protein